MRRRINETENSITFTGIESYYYYYVQNIMLFFVHILFQDLLDRNIFIHFCAMRGKKKTGGRGRGNWTNIHDEIARRNIFTAEDNYTTIIFSNYTRYRDEAIKAIARLDTGEESRRVDGRVNILVTLCKNLWAIRYSGRFRAEMFILRLNGANGGS